MKLLPILFVLVSLGESRAASTPIRSLITGSGGQLSLERGLYIVSKRTSDLTYLQLGVGVTAENRGRIQGLSLVAFREYLKPSELDLLIRNTSRAATTCFNLSEQRLNAIGYWLTVQNKSARRSVSSTFGPMKLRFGRDVLDDGTFYTVVTMNRAGTPGAAPWINYCTP